MTTLTRQLPKSLERLVNILENATLNHKLTPKTAHELVLKANVQIEDLVLYADFDHPVEDGYGRKMVFDGGRFEVMVMSWNPNHYSSVHNHGYTEWGVVQVFGNALNVNFAIKNNKIHLEQKEILSKGQAIKVNNALIHQMGNPSTIPYLSLHVYGSNERIQEVTADSKNYDLHLNRITHTTGGAFFNLPTHEIYDIEPSYQPTTEAFTHYATTLWTYYSRQENTPKLKALKKELLKKMEAFDCK